ncbi:MAG: hypothetical protein JXQ73_00430 [Phycisphaerae bacterium]|nr:hypothetical protein [Phycisphaerae bacterium]
MLITECRFGRITIDGQTYDKDLILHEGHVHPNWWRASGHGLCMEDLAAILAQPPEVLVIGRGHMKVLRVPATTREALAQRHVELIDVSTPKAVDRYLQLAAQGRRVSAGLHLTC